MKAKTQIWGFLLFPLSVILLISTAWLGLLYSFFSVPIKISFKGLYWWCNFYAGENAYNPELDDVKNDAGCKQ